jgi:ActR/RegA family two-component response regulator
VDDDPRFLKSMMRLLGRRGYRVVGFEEPERALAAIPGVMPDPGARRHHDAGRGRLELAEKIRARSHDAIPIVS